MAGLPAPNTPPRLAVGFDFGRRRIGIACGDTLSRTATPLTGVSMGPHGPPWEMLDALLSDWQPSLLVVGLPYNVDDSESGMTKAAREFARELEARFALPVHLVDERYSSLEAQSHLKHARQSGGRKRRIVKTDVDAAAACVILERWLSEIN